MVRRANNQNDTKINNHGLNPILCWTGGKNRLKNKIISKIPQHDIYIEPFLGGGSIFFKKNLANKNVVGDADSKLIKFYKSFKNMNCDSLNHCKLPKNQSEFNKAIQSKDKDACSFLAVNKRSYSCKMDKPNFSEAIANDPIRGKVGIENVKKNCSVYQDKLKKATILNGDYRDTVKKHDDKKAFIYLDPPFLNTYDYSQKHVNPTDVCSLAKKVKGKVMISYNDHPEVRKACQGLNIQKVNTSYTIQKSQTDGKDKKVQELLITNYPINEN